AAHSHVIPFLSPAATSARCSPYGGGAGGVLHPPGTPHPGEGQERRREALLRLLQDPREPLRRRRAPHLLEPRRHRPRPRRARGGSAGVGFWPQDFVPDRGHSTRGNPRWQAQVWG
ncbi:Os01g0958100, partial [Oryza sativa Japonica Group]